MFEITKAATDKLDEYLKDMEFKAIRIFLHAGGCGGPSLVMGFDEPKDTDHVFEANGYKFLINKELMKDARPIKVDFSEFKFQFDCALEFEEACSACAAAGGCG
jgi:Fe-S cluster assembly iron-binding protein IscA